MDPTRLLFPALRWSDEHGFGHTGDGVREALDRGVGGFILFGGEAEAAAHVVAELQERAPGPLLFGADLERGAGQQFEGCTPLPPAGALGSLDDLEVCRRAGRLTAREARALGIGWVYAPVADVANEAENPIVGTRAFDDDARSAGRKVAAWVRGCHEGGALACAKHFPGHGRTLADSHRELPVVEADRDALAGDLVPFAAAVEAGVASVMTAHVSYPALDPSGAPATRSRAVIEDLLRARLGFDGLVVTDALIMEGAAAGSAGEIDVAVEALDAGVDALLYPRDALALSDGLRDALAAGRLDRDRVRRSIGRVEGAARRVAGAVGRRGRAEDRRWARETALRTLRWLRPPPGPLEAAGRRLVMVDDDVGGPWAPPSRGTLLRGLGRMGVDTDALVEEGASPGDVAGRGRRGGDEDAPAAEGARGRVRAGSAGGATWLAVFCEPRGWKGRAGLSATSRRAVARRAPGADLVLLFGNPRLARDVPGPAPLLCAWGGEALMQDAAVREVERAVGGGTSVGGAAARGAVPSRDPGA